jgi:phospholipase/carboxylesterase
MDATRSGPLPLARCTQEGNALTQPSRDYQFIAGTAPGRMPLLLLHGSGGNEHELVPLASRLAPEASVLALRGSVEIDGGFAFFHRRPDRSIDEADLSARIPPLVQLIAAASEHHVLANPPVALGYSNGAIMAAALLLTCPTLLAGAILLRPLSPFLIDPPVRLDARPVLILDGAKDSRRSPGDGTRLAQRLVQVGAPVTHQILQVGHAITELDEQIVRRWLASIAGN